MLAKLCPDGSTISHTCPIGGRRTGFGSPEPAAGDLPAVGDTEFEGEDFSGVVDFAGLVSDCAPRSAARVRAGARSRARTRSTARRRRRRCVGRGVRSRAGGRLVAQRQQRHDPRDRRRAGSARQRGRRPRADQGAQADPRGEHRAPRGSCSPCARGACSGLGWGGERVSSVQCAARGRGRLHRVQHN